MMSVLIKYLNKISTRDEEDRNIHPHVVEIVLIASAKTTPIRIRNRLSVALKIMGKIYGLDGRTMINKIRGLVVTLYGIPNDVLMEVDHFLADTFI